MAFPSTERIKFHYRGETGMRQEKRPALFYSELLSFPHILSANPLFSASGCPIKVLGHDSIRQKSRLYSLKNLSMTSSETFGQVW
jgi:hypothetical protein